MRLQPRVHEIDNNMQHSGTRHTGTQHNGSPREVAGVPNGLILFDGVCVLCSRSARFVLARDSNAWFCFTPMQSTYGRALARRLGIDPENPETSAVIVYGRAHFKSDMVIAVLQRLPLWPWTRALALVPRPLRNWLYDHVAQNRYRLFGRTENCMVPTPEVTACFVHDDASAAIAVRRRPSPFEFLLGSDFTFLPAAVQRMHRQSHSLYASGRAEVSAGSGGVPRVLCWLSGLPPPGSDVPVTVAFHSDGHCRELWQRRFGDRSYVSTIRSSDAHAPGMLIEHFGLFDLYFRLTARNEGLAWSLVRWRLGGLSLPKWTTPHIECLESADGERYTFDIDVAFPLIGHIIRYKGWLELLEFNRSRNS